MASGVERVRTPFWLHRISLPRDIGVSSSGQVVAMAVSVAVAVVIVVVVGWLVVGLSV